MPDQGQQLAALLALVEGATWLVDRNLCLVAANATFQTLVTRQRGRPLAVGEPVLGVGVPPETSARWEAWYAQALAGETLDLEFEPYRQWAGAIIGCRVMPFCDADGTVVGVAAHSRDLTLQRQEQVALARSEERLRFALDAANEGLWDWDLPSGAVIGNHNWWTLFGYAPGEVPATVNLWERTLHPDDLQATMRALTDYLAGRAPAYHSEHRVITKHGAVRYHLSVGKAVAWDAAGRPTRMVGTNADITERKLAELTLQQLNAELAAAVAQRTAELDLLMADLARADAGKQAFLAAASHELRTPLTGMLSMAELLQQLSAPDAQLDSGPGAALGPGLEAGLGPGGDTRHQRYVAALVASGERLLDTVNLVLLYTQLASGAWVVQRQPLAWLTLCTSAAQAVAPALRRKRQQLSQQLEVWPGTFYGDAEAVRRLLALLLGNAVKFTPEGGTLALALAPAQDGSSVQLTVTDTGIGMDAATVARLFAPFAQGDGSLTRRFEGLGLGLACVQQLAALLGGSLNVESTPGVGSQFTVTLPNQANRA